MFVRAKFQLKNVSMKIHKSRQNKSSKIMKRLLYGGISRLLNDMCYVLFIFDYSQLKLCTKTQKFGPFLGFYSKLANPHIKTLQMAEQFAKGVPSVPATLWNYVRNILFFKETLILFLHDNMLGQNVHVFYQQLFFLLFDLIFTKYKFSMDKGETK